MQSREEMTVAHWLKGTQKGYIRIAVLILLGKKPYACASIKKPAFAYMGVNQGRWSNPWANIGQRKIF